MSFNAEVETALRVLGPPDILQFFTSEERRVAENSAQFLQSMPVLPAQTQRRIASVTISNHFRGDNQLIAIQIDDKIAREVDMANPANEVIEALRNDLWFSLIDEIVIADCQDEEPETSATFVLTNPFVVWIYQIFKSFMVEANKLTIRNIDISIWPRLFHGFFRTVIKPHQMDLLQSLNPHTDQFDVNFLSAISGIQVVRVIGLRFKDGHGFSFDDDAFITYLLRNPSIPAELELSQYIAEQTFIHALILSFEQDQYVVPRNFRVEIGRADAQETDGLTYDADGGLYTGFNGFIKKAIHIQLLPHEFNEKYTIIIEVTDA